jgi:serine/threonine protein kinase
MEYIHFKKLIHRDLKLENILLTKQLVAKISDFGISRVLNDNSNTKTKRVGTSLYMAPEVILTNNYDQKCDVFSFAIMMFQILTKKIENIYEIQKQENEKKIELNVELKTKNKKKYFKTEIELKESLLNNNNEEGDDCNDNENDFNLNIELRVANNPDLRPVTPKKFENKKYFEFVDVMRKCWKHDPKERPNFNEITMTLQEILENIKKKKNLN